jgi:hypothetical protein
VSGGGCSVDAQTDLGAARASRLTGVRGRGPRAKERTEGGRSVGKNVEGVAQCSDA